LAQDKPVLAYVCKDAQARTLRTFVVNVKEKSLSPGPLADVVLERGAAHCYALGRGVLVLAEEKVSWYGLDAGAALHQALPIAHPTLMTCACSLDPEQTRWLLSDDCGRLWLLVCVGAGSGTVTRLQLTQLGTTSVAAALCYIDSKGVFVAAQYGDSQLIRLLGERDEQSGQHIELLSKHANLGPVIDMCAVDLDGQGQSQIVTCSGAFKDGSLRVIRNGIGIVAEAELDLPNIVGLWSMKSQTVHEHDKYIAVSFAAQTVFLAMEDDELSECDNTGGLECAARTLFAGTVIADQIVQVVGNSVRLCSSATLAFVDQWKPGESQLITVAAGNNEHVAVVAGGRTVVLLKVRAVPVLARASSGCGCAFSSTCNRWSARAWLSKRGPTWSTKWRVQM
jgi:DNA damage-binding protein 1